jgi:hypothetical protein
MPKSDTLISSSSVQLSIIPGLQVNGEAAADQNVEPLPDYDEANFQGTLDRTYLTTVPPAEFSQTEEHFNNLGKLPHLAIYDYVMDIQRIARSHLPITMSPPPSTTVIPPRSRTALPRSQTP